MATATHSEESRAARDEHVPVYVWELPVRWAHWLIFLSLVVLSVTGLYIGTPYVVAVDADAYTMSLMRTIHFSGGFVFAIAVLARVIWGFIGNRYARWRAFVPIYKWEWRLAWKTFRFYTFTRWDPPRAIGHNRLAGAAYLVLFLGLIAEALTGFALYSVGREGFWSIFQTINGWLGIPYVRLIHHLLMWLIIAFFLHHLASVIITDVEERNGLVTSMFSGYKHVKRSDLESDQEDDG